MQNLVIIPTDEQAAALTDLHDRAGSALTVEEFSVEEIGTHLDQLVTNKRATALQTALQQLQDIAKNGTSDDLAAAVGAVDATAKSVNTAIAGRLQP